uniref:VWFA domain-containing protein n=1 Tax=Hucho hucho TaxID=62062 RepID=A0A4W5RA71_9TELE
QTLMFSSELFVTLSNTTVAQPMMSGGMPSMIKEWVDQIHIELVTLADTASAGKSLTQIFLDNQNLYTVESNAAEELVARAARNIEQLLLKRAAALEVRHRYLCHLLQDGDIVYYNAKDNLEVNHTEGRKNRIRPVFKEDPLFKRFTSDNDTAVHIPTDIYDGSTIVLNELNWTEALEDVFKKNREDDPTLLWQVFGSATGLARYYPASPWMDARKTPSKIDLYDVRRRPWYIQGAASPKDMLILVDASGSVSGLTLKLIKTSVSEMLETLSDDDYVNVVYFNTRGNNTACFDHLVQANVRNKKILKDAIQNISAKGITNYTKGFEFAFEQLYAVRANCNKIIMLFTDGGEERASAILQEYNSDKKVRIFTFSVGQHNYDKGPVQWMACANKGYFYEIPSIGAIRINTQEYLDVLGRPMVLADQLAKQVQWTNVYLDALKLTPRYTIGPNGYYFAIDPNGYVLLHPNLQPKVCSILTSSILLTRLDRLKRNPKFQEPVTLDFLDAELENDVKVQVNTHTQVLRYIDRGVRTYTWAQVNGTDYSSETTLHPIAVATSGHLKGLDREYCKGLKDKDNNTQFLLDFNQFIDRNTVEEPCKLPCLSHPLLLNCDWFLCVLSVPRGGVLARFVATDGGITRVYPRRYTQISPSHFYKRTLDNDIYIFTAPYFNGMLTHNETHTRTRTHTHTHTHIHTHGSSLQCGLPANPGRPHVDCVILDDGGFLMMSNQDEYITQIGQFFGEVDPVVMISLANTSLYSFNKTYNYQSVCNPERDCKAAGSQSSVKGTLQLTWFAKRHLQDSQCLSLSLSLFLSLSLVDSDDDMSANMFKESCITEQTQYFFDNEERSYSGVLDCGNCSRMYRAEKLPNTNLVFLITDAKTTCLSCDPIPLRQAEQPSQGPDPCELAQNPRYRKGPDICFDNNVDVSQTRAHTYFIFLYLSISLSLSLSLSLLLSLSISWFGCSSLPDCMNWFVSFC